MITNKELALSMIDKVIEEYQLIIDKKLFTKKLRSKQVGIFGSKSILCQIENSKKICHRDPNKGCFFYQGVTGCSRAKTFPLNIFRDNTDYLKTRLEFWKNLRIELELSHPDLFLKKNRGRLHGLTSYIEDIIYKKNVKNLIS